MLCKNCGTENVPEAKVCSNCGASLIDGTTNVNSNIMGQTMNTVNAGNMVNPTPNVNMENTTENNAQINSAPNAEMMGQTPSTDAINSTSNVEMLNSSSGMDTTSSNVDASMPNTNPTPNAADSDIIRPTASFDSLTSTPVNNSKNTDNNKKKMIVIIALVVALVAIIGIGAYLIGNKDNANDNTNVNNNGNNTNINEDETNPGVNEDENDNDQINSGVNDEEEENDDTNDDVVPVVNTVEVQANGLTYEVPRDYMYYVTEDSLLVTDSGNSWQISFGKANFSYEVAKANLGRFLIEFIDLFGPSFKLSEKTVNGLDTIYGEVVYNNQYVKIMMSALNDTTTNLVAVVSLTDDDNIVDLATDILKTATVSRDIDTSGFVDFETIKGIVLGVNEQA